MTAVYPPAEGGERRPGNGARSDEPVLLVEDIHTFYGSIEALKGISLEVHEGEIVTLIGANGAGKTTTLRSISGIVPPRIGRIVFSVVVLPAPLAPIIATISPRRTSSVTPFSALIPP